MSEQSCKYWAFISYSHQDKVWGGWLHKALETYRVPKPLVGKPTERGYDVPARVFPVFRDREELPTSAELGRVINQALEQSQYLIVICSPHSAQSLWVNEEIKAFKRLGRENRILCIIVDGEPNASDEKPGTPEDAECFPEAVRFKLGGDGGLTSERTEPIAADAREGKDGKRNALLKLLAGVLGVNFDDLRQRDRLRQRHRRFCMAAGLLLALAGLAFAQMRFAAIRREKVLQAGRAALANARKALSDRQPALAVEQALVALNSEAGSDGQLEPARWVLKRALDANLVESHWQAHHGRVSECAFDASGGRLMTFSSDDEEARVWSVADGRLLSSIKLANKGGWLAGWCGTNEILTASSFAGADGEAKVELAWWSSDSGRQLRKVVLNQCINLDIRQPPTTGLPEWIAVHEYRAQRYRLVRVRDGEAKSIIPEPAGAFHLPMCLSACGVVLLPDPEGIRLFALEGGRALGRLEGVGPGKDLHLECPIASADRKRFAAFVWEGKNMREVGVWRATDGGRAISYPEGKLELNRADFMAVAPGDRLLSNSKKLLAALAVPLGRQPIELPAWNAAGAVWADVGADGSAVAAVFGRDCKGRMVHPGLGLESDLDIGGAEFYAACFSPGGRWLATGDNRGGITLWRTSVAVEAELELPKTVQFAKPRITGEKASSSEVLLQSPIGGDRVVVWDVAARRSTAIITGLVAPEGSSLEFGWNPTDALLIATPEMPITLTPTNFPTNWKTTFYDTKSGRMLWARPVTQAILAPRGKRALAWGKDYWELVQVGQHGLAVVPLAPAHPAVSAYAGQAVFTPDGEHVITATVHGWVEVHSAQTGLSERSFRFANELDTSVNYLNLSPSGHWALLGTFNRWWRLNLITGQSLEVFTTGRRPSGACAFLNGEQTLVGDTGGELQWWSFPDLIAIASVHGQYDPELTLPLDETGELLLRQSYGGIVVADARSGAVRLRFEKTLAVDLKGCLAVVEAENAAQIVRLRDGEILADLPPASAACIAPDGSRVGLVLPHSDHFVSVPISVTETELRARAQQLKRWKSVLQPQHKE
jgi:WD40 repeat protein